jgi:S1-C subfamily serine protease
MSSKQTSGLADLSSQLSRAVENAAAFTVAIHARRRIPSSGIIWRDDLIVAASHTVRRDGDVPVTLASGESVTANVIGRGPGTDLILLRANGVKSTAERSEEWESSVGSFVLAVGRAGKDASASFGIISARVRSWRTGQGTQLEGVLRLDMGVYDGFSGGPLVAASGRLIGLNNSALARGGAAALSAPAVDAFVDEMLSRGHVRRPFIGVAVHPATLPQMTVNRHKLSSDSGLVVLSVGAGSPAERAGILVGDVLLRAETTLLERMSDLLDAIVKVEDGKSLDLSLLRGGAPTTVSVSPIDRGSAAEDDE